MTPLALLGLPTLRVIDIFDIVIVAVLVYYLYRMARGTNVMLIFWALLILLVAWRVADTLGMKLLGAILSAVAGVGLIALVVIFQPEIRKSLLFLGTKTQLNETFWKRLRFWRRQQQMSKGANYEAYVNACMHMSQSRTGALIVFKRQNSVDELVETGERINALASSALIEALFFKNSPLHDGAVIAHENQLIAARCILPVTSRIDIDPNLGLRHRSAIGVTEQLDVLSVIVSEETGAISYALGGVIHHDITPVELRQALERYQC
ncbi:MAG: diadenylate cyclase CdaA [Bacteroidales bacterium]|nr:diadenylate cyclase CdaA [Bacteroidales bacterium]